MRFRDFVDNSRQCKLYDYDTGTWLTYAEAPHLARPGRPSPSSLSRRLPQGSWKWGLKMNPDAARCGACAPPR